MSTGAPKKWAAFDPEVDGPKPVIAWYDTALGPYAVMPSQKSRVRVTDAQWALHIETPTGWTVVGGKLIEPGA